MEEHKCYSPIPHRRHRQPRSLRALVIMATFVSLVWSWPFTSVARAADLAVTAWFDGERSEAINAWGGPFASGSIPSLTLQDKVVGGGRQAVEIDLGQLNRGASRSFDLLAAGVAPTEAYRQTRDLQRFEAMQFALANRTGAPLRMALEVRDDRDRDDHRGQYWFTLGAEPEWQYFSVPIGLDAPNWQWSGDVHLDRVALLRFIVQVDDAPLAGSIFLDNMTLREPGGPISIEEAPMPVLVERVARRGWDALWSARSPKHGLIPNNSYQSTDAALNSTAGVLWMLPAAVRRGWVAREAADQYVAQVLGTLNQLLDKARFVPPRYVDWATLRPSLLPEESSVDAAFLFLALYQYQSLPGTSAALVAEIERVRDRMQFDAFSGPAGWRMSYRYPSPYGDGGFADLTYDGYTNENKVVSLAAHLANAHHVDIATNWNTDVNRIREKLSEEGLAPAVHSLRSYRAPFTQALLNLFVDVRERGLDNFPDATMATNPWTNFVDYEQQVMQQLRARGRPWLVQPDAGDDGSLANYQQFSLYDDFGQADLFMPWSVSFALLARAPGAEEAFRFQLAHGLCDALGLADSARWATGADQPYAVTARHDFWNTALTTMALLEYLDGDDRQSRRFAELPAVRAALDRVFPQPVSASPEMAAAQ